MKPKKIVRYRIQISRTFPATHPRKGDPTFFVEELLNGIIPCSLLSNQEIERLSPFSEFYFNTCEPKLHTCRKNYPLWEKRFKNIMGGEAVLELYYWSGKPRKSKTVTICQLGKDDGIGLQEMMMYKEHHGAFICNEKGFDPMVFDWSEIAKNDGLSLPDFEAWFKNYDINEPLAIIHFTPFRY